MPPTQNPDAHERTQRRWYVTMSWEDFPEGGTYGDIFTAPDDTTAEQLCRQAMAECRADGFDFREEEGQAEYWLERYADDWHVIDCWDLDEFIERHRSNR